MTITSRENLRITVAHVRKARDRWSGYLKVSNGETVRFAVSRKEAWQQWGAKTKTLCFTMPTVQRLERDLWEGEDGDGY